LLRKLARLLARHSSVMSEVAPLYPIWQCWMEPPSSPRLGSGWVWNSLPVSTRMPSICTNSKQNMCLHPSPTCYTYLVSHPLPIVP
jgi:hypothetical protein